MAMRAVGLGFNPQAGQIDAAWPTPCRGYDVSSEFKAALPRR